MRESVTGHTRDEVTTERHEKRTKRREKGLQVDKQSLTVLWSLVKHLSSEAGFVVQKCVIRVDIAGKYTPWLVFSDLEAFRRVQPCPPTLSTAKSLSKTHRNKRRACHF